MIAQPAAREISSAAGERPAALVQPKFTQLSQPRERLVAIVVAPGVGGVSKEERMPSRLLGAALRPPWGSPLYPLWSLGRYPLLLAAGCPPPTMDDHARDDQGQSGQPDRQIAEAMDPKAPAHRVVRRRCRHRSPRQRPRAHRQGCCKRRSATSSCRRCRRRCRSAGAAAQRTGDNHDPAAVMPKKALDPVEAGPGDAKPAAGIRGDQPPAARTARSHSRCCRRAPPRPRR